MEAALNADRVLAVYVDGVLVGHFEPDVRVVVGRSPSVHVQIMSAKLSRQHLTLEIDEGGQILLVDIGSACGVWVAGKRVAAQSFPDEVEIFLADHTLTAQIEPRRSR